MNVLGSCVESCNPYHVSSYCIKQYTFNMGDVLPIVKRSVADVWKELSSGRRKEVFDKLWYNIQNDAVRSDNQAGTVNRSPRHVRQLSYATSINAEQRTVGADLADNASGAGHRAMEGVALERCVQQLLDPDRRTRRIALELVQVCLY